MQLLAHQHFEPNPPMREQTLLSLPSYPARGGVHTQNLW